MQQASLSPATNIDIDILSSASFIQGGPTVCVFSGSQYMQLKHVCASKVTSFTTHRKYLLSPVELVMEILQRLIGAGRAPAPAGG